MKNTAHEAYSLVADYFRFKVWQQTPKYGPKKAVIMVLVSVACRVVAALIVGFSLGPAFATVTDEVKNKPSNIPTYEAYREAASQLCQVETDRPGLVRSGNHVVAGHVIVVRGDGVMERMDTTEAWDRTKSKTTTDDVWVIGVCKADIQNQGVKI